MDSYRTIPAPTGSPERLQYVDVYMDDLNCLTQGGPSQQRRVSKLVLRAITETYSSLSHDLKDSVSLKKALMGDGDWSHIKEIIGWVINTKMGTFSLSPNILADLQALLAISATQRRLSRKKLEKLIGKLQSMHLAVPSAIGHFYCIR